MEMCYDGALVMPSSFAVVEQDEMSYVNGGGTFSKTVRGNAAKLRVAHYFGVSAASFVALKASIVGIIAGAPTVVGCLAACVAALGSWMKGVTSVFNAVASLIYTIKYNGFKYSGFSTAFGIGVEFVSRI